ncbi:hypothetical protein PHLGIDRAFT_468206 [Phlebiopsis gigantea 11061_1 CR5-6]|uniref:Uncharacterized protein n=1 Tax=Phlebiopsis gigantea (strain 11061_1 CR5-6) TaxID=745531 RepID=A0A0C3NMC9_PHLG1|nr:hypothetical protein PHLGIDRAFT_468206 [Phlebiopsis gigantea 11061_1 CR5-6]
MQGRGTISNHAQGSGPPERRHWEYAFCPARRRGMSTRTLARERPAVSSIKDLHSSRPREPAPGPIRREPPRVQPRGVRDLRTTRTPREVLSSAKEAAARLSNRRRSAANGRPLPGVFERGAIGSEAIDGPR